jgi:hypothetical protein
MNATEFLKGGKLEIRDGSGKLLMDWVPEGPPKANPTTNAMTWIRIPLPGGRTVNVTRYDGRVLIHDATNLDEAILALQVLREAEARRQ